MSGKRVFSLDAPDQQRLKVARLEIEAVLAKHDLAGVCVLHTPGMAEFFYSITPSYSVCWIDEAARAVRIKSAASRDHAGDLGTQLLAQAATANMTGALAGEIGRAASMFSDVDRIVSALFRAEHTAPKFVPDPSQRLPS